MSLLYGVEAQTLAQANVLVEQALCVKMQARESLFNGGEYYILRLSNHSVKLRENIDLDDTEHEFDGLHEPDFPNFKWLLYVEGEVIPLEVVDRLDKFPTAFVRLRST